MILSKEQARAHERTGRRLVRLTIAGTVAMFAGFGFGLPWLALPLVIATLYWNVSLFFYIRKDLRLRGSRPFWVFVPGFNLCVLLLWRRWHPLRIREW